MVVVQENAAGKQAGLEEAPAETGTALAGRQTLEVLSGAESIADALELAAAEAERHRVRPSPLLPQMLSLDGPLDSDSANPDVLYLHTWAVTCTSWILQASSVGS